MSPHDQADVRARLQDLLVRVVGGESGAYEALFVALRPHLHDLVRRYLGPGPHPGLDSSGIVQSGLRRLHEHFDRFRQEDPSASHLLAWVQAIVSNRAVDELRRRRRRPPAAGGSGGPEPADPHDPQADAEREHRSARLVAALARLPERQRQVVEWHWFDRLRDREISSRLGGSVEAIRVLRFRALRALRRHLEDLDDAPG